MSNPPPPTSYVPVRSGSPQAGVTNSDTYASLASTARGDNFLSPEQIETDTLLGRTSAYPAPSILSRNSSIPGTPPLGGDNRQSWGSNLTLSGAAAGFAGAEGRPSVPRGQSTLAHSSLGWNNTSSDQPPSPGSNSDDEEGQGHIAPAAATGVAAGAGLSEKSRWAPKGPSRGYDLPPTAGKRNRKWLWIGIGAGLFVVVGLAVGLGVGLSRSAMKATPAGNSNANSGSSGSGSSGSASGTATSSGTAASATPTTGGQGSLITLENGNTFTYNNPFGGKWVWDAANPFNNEAQANSWTPKLSQNWTWGVDKVRGVNLGGWLNTEPFIVPSLYERYANVGGQLAVDEYTLSQNMGSNLTAELTNHYETFITEQDIAEIASAGLNWVRIPIAFWAIETWPGEPYLERVSWTYFLKAIQWCRKYGIRINLDFHTMPGSQNGWNHSGHLGSINWLNGVMGTANAQRALDYIRTLAEFIAQPEYRDVIQLFGFVNEPNANGIGQAPVGSFYYEAYKIIRSITGIGQGNGPMLSIHDGFLGISAWQSFLPGADRLALDQHPYMIFGNQPTGTLAQLAKNPCDYWAVATNGSSNTYGVTVAGEWSAASNDCGYWINNVGQGARYDGTYSGFTATGSCALWNDYTQWNQTIINFVHDFTAASMDALQDYFFWTWRIGNSTASIKQPNPAWHYKLGLERGWIPSDPRVAVGWCANLGVDGSEFSGKYSQPYMTGGVGANTIAASWSSSYPWPPRSYTNVPAASMSLLPQYTQTGTPITMPALTYTAPGTQSTINAGSGWQGTGSNRQAYAAIAGCSYPPEYSAASLAIPTTACGAGLTQAVKRFPAPTPAPTPA